MRKTLLIVLVAGSFLLISTGNSLAIDQWPDTGWTNGADCWDNDGILTNCASSDDYPGQDGSHAGPERNYTDNVDGTVSDNVTGLMWEQDGTTSVPVDFQGAGNYISQINTSGSVGGYQDWRLPTVQELATLVDHSQYGHAIDTIFAIDPVVKRYWTDTNYSNDPVNMAWTVSFNTAMVGEQHVYGSSKTNSYSVLAVRDIQ